MNDIAIGIAVLAIVVAVRYAIAMRVRANANRRFREMAETAMARKQFADYANDDAGGHRA